MKRSIAFALALSMLLTITVGASSMVKKYNSATIDASTSKDGYFSACYNGGTEKRMKVMVEKGGERYTYDLKNNGESEVYPLQMGDGMYKLRVLRNISGTKYSIINTFDVDVKLENPHSPFLNASQYVSYTENSNVVKIAQEITKNAANTLEKVDIVYNHVINAMKYDREKAKTVKSGYLPDVDMVTAAQKGICFDYAAVMAAMLRSLGIPTKLVTGYVAPNNGYHAWNEVYIEDIGWIKTGKLYFDGVKWTVMDATFMSTGGRSESIIKFIADSGKNYKIKYVY